MESGATQLGDTRFEVRTWFVRGRSVLLARADFGALYVDYYLHFAQQGRRPATENDQLLKDTLAALTLHAASRPLAEVTAWTVSLQQPRVNLFVTSDSIHGRLIANLFTEHVKPREDNVFMSEVADARNPLRRSTVNFRDADIFHAVEEYYRRSEQRPARLFRCGPEDFAMVSAHPDYDQAWFDALTTEQVRHLAETETLRPLELRKYSYECGCNQERLMALLAPTMRNSPEELFGGQERVIAVCPRCGTRHNITRESMEAFLNIDRP